MICKGYSRSVQLAWWSFLSCLWKSYLSDVTFLFHSIENESRHSPLLPFLLLFFPVKTMSLYILNALGNRKIARQSGRNMANLKTCLVKFAAEIRHYRPAKATIAIVKSRAPDCCRQFWGNTCSICFLFDNLMKIKNLRTFKRTTVNRINHSLILSAKKLLSFLFISSIRIQLLLDGWLLWCFSINASVLFILRLHPFYTFHSWFL